MADHPEPNLTLADLRPGERAVVTRLDSTGLERRRLMDLGVLPGTIICAEAVSPLGDPTAYLIRGGLIALRLEQARQIHIAHDNSNMDNAKQNAKDISQ